jgi:Ca-activated chloride channel homolog
MSFRAGVLSVLAVTAVVHPRTVRAQIEERAIYASVLDRAGAPVKALQTTDFIVREDGVQREILRVSPATDPLRIAVLVDTSRAIRPHVSNLREGLRAFVRELHGRDEIALYEFGERPTLLVDYTTDPTRLDAGIGRLFDHPASGAYVLDAIIEVSRNLRTREGARPIIVVVTAEGPEFSERYHQTVLDDLRDSDATLHALVVGRRRGSPIEQAALERDLTLAKGSRNTGGRHEYLLTSMALTDRLRALAAELQNQYRVVYARPPALIPPETIVVDVTRPALTVRAPRVPQSHTEPERGRAR